MNNIITYREAIEKSMHHALENNKKSIIYGVGVTDHIGIFGTTAGLEKKYGSDRVFDTPIAEDSMTGFAIGASLGGLYPIHIHIRADFLLLTMNQLINSAAKYRYTYGGLFHTPMLIRAVIGRSWGQGAQHSQSLQSLFAHIPGLTVIMPSSAEAAEKCYKHAVMHYKNPVISFEHRLLYDYKFNNNSSLIDENNPFDSYLVQEGNDITIVASSIMVQEAIKASDYISKYENISIEIIDINSVSHPNQTLILNSIGKTGKLIVADTSWLSHGLGAEISRMILETDVTLLKKPMKNLGMAKATCPTAKKLEYEFYPNLKDLVVSIYDLHFGSLKGKEIPSEEEIVYQYKYFKGPF